MPTASAGLVLYNIRTDALRVLLGHLGGPYYARKHAGAWTIPKGAPAPGEALLAAALREFEEEVGVRPVGTPWPLTPVVQRSGKRVHAWALEGAVDEAQFRSNTFTLEWPPRSGRQKLFPELDRIAWLTVAEACALAVPGQAALFRELEARLADPRQ